MIKTTKVTSGGKEITFETGKLAGQATAAVLATMGDNVVLATIVMSGQRDDIDWFPLQVEYREKLYSGGKIKGSRWVKRDGRPSDDTILTARLIDRSIRPLFPDGFKNEIQIIVTPLSVDSHTPVDMLALNAVTAALTMSEIPWNGPVGAVRVGMNPDTKDLIINPTFEQLETSKLDLIVSATKDAILMVEAGANEVSEQDMLSAFEFAHQDIKNVVAGINTFAKEVGNKKIDFTPPVEDAELKALLTKEAKSHLADIVKGKANVDRHAESALLDKLFASYAETYSKKSIMSIVSDLIKKEARRGTLENNSRPDGRKPDEIRPISSEVGVLPRTHGSALFNRGKTQALTIATLASPSYGQIIEGAEGEEKTKHYFHHYNMPPFTVGEAGRIGWPSRREVGHGALAERALLPMIPSEEEFPYTIQVVSEIMSSNGSTSMASVCGSTLSLMDAGVNLMKPVAGIAMGLITDGKKYIVLSDIAGFEDHTGDMDFKVAGTKDGITAMQMDVKISGIPADVLEKALEQARVGRLHILEAMLKPLPSPRTQLSQYAPKIITVKIPVDRIGEIIGPGGKIIKGIIADSGAEVDVDDDGNVFISSTDQAAMDKAKSMVEGIIKVVEAGEEYDGKVVRLMNFGAFVEILPGKDGLVHVSRMSTSYVSDPSTIVKVGDKVHVRVTEIDDQGRINLTMLTPEQEQEAKNNRPPQRDNRSRGPRRQSRRDRY